MSNISNIVELKEKFDNEEIELSSLSSEEKFQILKLYEKEIIESRKEIKEIQSMSEYYISQIDKFKKNIKTEE